MATGRARRKLLDNFKIDLRQLGRIGMNWIGLAHDRALVNEVMNKMLWLHNLWPLSSIVT
jgi:hypothetical protein